MSITLTNSLSKLKEQFVPIDADHIKMYVCGPTVYDRPHLGNARSAVIYDVLFRVLKYWYPKVTYVRNITDIDDKIIDASNKQNVSINDITTRYTEDYHNDIAALGCLVPTLEPKATQNLEQMIELISQLLSNGHAYEANGHILFDTNSYADYGALSKRSLDEMIAGARVEVAPFKKNPTDFVLWKPAKPQEKNCSFQSPWGLGRPGWHIECSAMSARYLGHSFDIHGGGADLMFPHHENEIAQTKCAIPGAAFARYWVHNGFLTVNGEKMSKSLKNFKTVFELLQDGVSGSVIRYFYLTTHYRKPLDFNSKAVADAKKSLEKFSSIIHNNKTPYTSAPELSSRFIEALSDDLNSPKALSHLHALAAEASAGDLKSCQELQACCDFLGLDLKDTNTLQEINPVILELAEKRAAAKNAQKWAEADSLRAEINRMGYEILDKEGTYTIQRQSSKK